jgi:hypothetical protein
MKKLSWFVIFLVLTASCLDDPDCFQLHNDVLGVTFRVIGTGQGDSVLLKNFFNQGENKIITSFNAKLNYFEEQDVFYFEGEKNNFLAFGYTVKNQFISEDCGSSFELSDLHILDHDFDSVRILNSTPSKGQGTNIEIYRCPSTDTLTINFNQLYVTTTGVTISNRRSAFISHPFDFISDSVKEVFSGSAATVKLPVHLDKNQTTFIFKTDVAQDTLVVTYNSVTEQRYRPCGIQTFVSNLRYGNNTFDSVSYGLNSLDEPVRSLLDPHVANLRIFDCPQTNLLQVGFKSSANVAQTVTIKSITADHLTGDLLTDTTTTAVVLPVDLDSNVSTFYIQYDDDTIDTLRVQYEKSPLTLFNACKNPIIMNVSEALEDPDIAVLPTSTTLQFPPVTNVEIIIH